MKVTSAASAATELNQVAMHFGIQNSAEHYVQAILWSLQILQESGTIEEQHASNAGLHIEHRSFPREPFNLINPKAWGRVTCICECLNWHLVWRWGSRMRDYSPSALPPLRAVSRICG